MVNAKHNEMTLKQFGIFILIVPLLFICTTKNVYTMSFDFRVYVHNYTDYDLAFNFGDEAYNLPAHTGVMIKHEEWPPIVVTFWHAGATVDNILFTATIKQNGVEANLILITTDEQGEFVCEVEMVE
jgi:hypothetical protein